MRGKNILGRRYGRLAVTFGPVSGAGPCLSWICLCDCGKEKRINGSNLRLGKTLSCGCLQKERSSAGTQTHGLSKSAEYNVWCKMRLRCGDPAERNYPRYGGRGIRVCDRWKNFEAFIADMGPRPSPSHSIERKDNNSDYSPSNCIWALPKQQQNNKSTNVVIELDGHRLTVTQWAERIGIKDKTLYARLASGWSPERVITEPLRRTR